MREKSPLGEDGYSSAARLVLVVCAAGRHAAHWLGERQSPIPEHPLGSIPGPLADHLESKLQWWGVAAGGPARCAIGPLFARSSGGIASDIGNKISGMRGRLIAQSVCLIGEGILLIVFSKQKTIGAAIPCLVAFSFFVQATEGTSFGIVPYICPEGLGGVCAVVGAWGNIGAVCWGMMFKFGYIGKFDKGYEAMGYIIIASSVFSIFMRIKGQKTMFGTLEDQ